LNVTTGFSTSAADNRLDRSGSRKRLGPDRVGLVVFALLAVFLFPSVGGAGNGNGTNSPTKGQKAPTSTALPTISGTVVVGQTLSASTGSWSGGVSSYAYQWLRCDGSGNNCSSLGGAVSSSYVPVVGDVSYRLRVSVTASNKAGSSVATSNPTSAVAAAPVATAPVNTALPTISGSTVVGQTLAASTGTWSWAPASYAYQWRRCDSAGASCASISGATANSYALQSADAGSTVRVVVTATNTAGSTSATSAQSSVVATTTPPPPSGYPASFFTGPAGSNNLLPANGSYPSKGAWIGEESANGLTQTGSREQYFGRKFNIYAYYAQNRCDPYPSILADVVSSGHIPLISWYPTPAYADQIIAGAADNCIKSFGNAIAAQAARVFIRPYWEFNGGWYNFSKNSDGTRATADEEKQVWQHTVDVLRTTNALSKASMVWCPHEGYYNNGDAYNNPTPYPGDNYVDWVCSDVYNVNLSTAWCGFHAGWCTFAESFTHGYYAPKYTPRGVEMSFRGRKPFMVGETGSVEDPNTLGRKGQWMVDMGNYAKTYMPGLYALIYWDATTSGGRVYSLDSSTSSMDGFKLFANDPYFSIPNS
jgi:Glycosyl hydrolase family 26